MARTLCTANPKQYFYSRTVINTLPSQAFPVPSLLSVHDFSWYTLVWCIKHISHINSAVHTKETVLKR